MGTDPIGEEEGVVQLVEVAGGTVEGSGGQWNLIVETNSSSEGMIQWNRRSGGGRRRRKNARRRKRGSGRRNRSRRQRIRNRLRRGNEESITR
mmetsp:Transcript_5940/g.11520  ORF Transcript_5940/g.11520 Transcript_5940/m.11520 type:complete len:93 (-) Transcript_5940:15-293(-)